METFAGMRMFTEVVESGSFSAAGRRLGLAASSVARAIGALENQLGVRLLNRTTRKLGLTEAGRLYHERSRRILAEVDEARLSVTQLEAAPRGTLRLNVPVVFGRLHIAPALPDFLALHPALRVDLAVTDAFVDLVEEGVDLAIRIGELEDSSLIARRLAPNRRVLCASPAYLDRHGIPTSPHDLSEHNCLMYKQQNRSVWRLRDDARIHEIRVSGPLLANNADVLHTAALGGVGLTILPIWLVGRDIQRGALKIVLADYQVSPGALDTNIYAVFPHSRHLSAKVRAFIDFMHERIGTHPYWEVDDRRVCAKPPLEAAAS
jgi:DNA-binding transcriptional LysR family regulator